MQSSRDNDVDIDFGIDCVCLASSTLGRAALPRLFPRCSQRLPPPLFLLSSSLHCCRHCCHPHHCGTGAPPAETACAPSPHILFVDCCVAATAAAFVANSPSCSSQQAGCRVASHHADTFRPSAPPPLVTPPPLVAPLSCLLPGWLLRCLLPHIRLPSTSTSTYHMLIFTFYYVLYT